LPETRAATWKEDFVIEKSEVISNLVHVAGIQSPGFASAPAIAEMVEGIVKEIFESNGRLVKPNGSYESKRVPLLHMEKMTLEERAQVIKKNPSFAGFSVAARRFLKGKLNRFSIRLSSLRILTWSSDEPGVEQDVARGVFVLHV
jgi:glycerol-3-phosphate dehydrogenase